MQPVSIRPLALDDYETWLTLWQGYQAFYKVTIDQAITATTWSRLLEAGEPVNGALALADGQPVGLVHWIFHRSTWTSGNYCYLQDLFVGTEARGRGAGRTLIEHVSAQARQAGCSRVYWLTHEANKDAMVLYDRVAERSGFVQYRQILG